MNIREVYQLWTINAVDDPDLQQELKEIEQDDVAIHDRFYKDLEFGTAGLRGVIGAGTDRMNIYTVRRATQGLAQYLNETDGRHKVAISYDSRNKSRLFAEQSAAVLAGNGIKALLFKDITPVPVLSFAIRHLGCDAGIMITASHNPAAYNGFKCYGPDGCQMTDRAAGAVYGHIQKIDYFSDIQMNATASFSYIEDDVIEAYYHCCLKTNPLPEMVGLSGLKVLYTPLCGSGAKFVPEALKRAGLERLFLVEEQMKPDGNFATCSNPNPESKEAFALAYKQAEKENPDIILATDPDCDRIGAAVRNERAYQLLTGNELGCLILHYILLSKKLTDTMPESPVFIQTIVTTPMAEKIAAAYGCGSINTLTGFKYIGEQIGILEREGNAHNFIFAFEESNGYLPGVHARDKDAVASAALICEMAGFYKQQGLMLIQALEGLSRRYGSYCDMVKSYVFEAESGARAMDNLMLKMRENPPEMICGLEVTRIDDYLTGIGIVCKTGEKIPLLLPKSDVLVFHFDQIARIAIRPSGTEPKMKLYYSVAYSDKDGSMAILEAMMDEMNKIILPESNAG